MNGFSREDCARKLFDSLKRYMFDVPNSAYMPVLMLIAGSGCTMQNRRLMLTTTSINAGSNLLNRLS
ncbi:hypothetical protein EBR21_04425 [bacterium]|nr:hypothetical protein [bacterium]